MSISLVKLVKLPFSFLKSFATGFIIPVNKDSQLPCMLTSRLALPPTDAANTLKVAGL